MTLINTMLGLVALAAVGYAIWTFNSLVRGRNACTNARASIDVNLVRRHQLIPNLVNAIKGYTQHEQQVLVAVTDARRDAQAALGQSSSAGAEARLETQLSGLRSAVEAYPELQADELFMNLMKNLTEAEEQISASRRAFNGQVMRQNNLVQQFPSLLVARLFGYIAIESYQAEPAAHDAVSVSLAGSA